MRINRWSGVILSLILLAANVGAPFRTSAIGRTFLDGQCQDAVTGAQIRVRAIAGADVAHGFRAVVGISGGDRDALELGAGSQPYPSSRLLLSAASPPRQACPPAGRPACPLRC